MISVASDILESARHNHVSSLKLEISRKRDVLILTEKFIKRNGSIVNIKELTKNIKELDGTFNLKKTAVNWFLKNSKKKSNKYKVTSWDNLNKFFDINNRRVQSTPECRNEIKRVLAYFTDVRIDRVLGSKPDALLDTEIKDYINFCNLKNSSNEKKYRELLVSYLFSYPSFITQTVKYDAYQLTRELKVEACLYCNRSYILTVERGKNKIIRPELDHYFPKADFPLLALSFYNLIPSCHICNSNLKGKKDFNLDDYFHPYLGSFDKHDVKFTYRPKNAKAFIDGDDDGLNIKLDTRYAGGMKDKIDKNVEVFKLDEIYNCHESLVKQLQKMRRLSNENYLDWIREKIFIDENENPRFSNNKEVYELVMMNFYKPSDYAKRPMAKFLKDIAIELKLID